MPPPNPEVTRPPATVRPERVADAPVPIWNTRLELLPLTDSNAAPGPVIVVVTASVRSSSPLVRGMVCGVLNRLPKVIVGPTPATWLVSLTAWRSVPAPPSAVLTTRALKAPGLETEIDG